MNSPKGPEICIGLMILEEILRFKALNPTEERQVLTTMASHLSQLGLEKPAGGR